MIYYCTFNIVEALVEGRSNQEASQNSGTEPIIAETLKLQENSKIYIQSVIAAGTRE